MTLHGEVGVPDFVLLDEITIEKFMANLKKRWEHSETFQDITIGCGLTADIRSKKRFLGWLFSEFGLTARAAILFTFWPDKVATKQA